MEIKKVPHSGRRYIKFDREEIEKLKEELRILTGVKNVSYYHNPHSLRKGSLKHAKKYKNVLYWHQIVTSTINPMNGKEGKGFNSVGFCPKKITQ